MTATTRRRPTIIDRLRTVYVFATLWLALIAYIVLAGPYLVVAGLTFDRTRSQARRIVRAIFPRLVRIHCRMMGTPWIVDLPPFDANAIGPCIVVANHSSLMDSVLLMGLPRGLGDGRVWAKSWPFKVPLLGWLMRLSGHLFVDDFNILPDAQSCLSDGTSLLVFPEASRTRTGQLGRFRDGAFLLAVRTNRPVVPVAIRGSFESIPPGQPWIFHPKLRVTPLGVLYPDPAEAKPHLNLKRRAHELIAKALNG